MYCSPHIIRMIEPRTMRGMGHGAPMEKGEVYAACWWGNLRERDRLEGPGVDGMIKLKWIFRNRDGVMDWICLGKVTGTCECGNEPSGSIKCREFLG